MVALKRGRFYSDAIIGFSLIDYKSDSYRAFKLERPLYIESWALSPDGRRIAFNSYPQFEDVWSFMLFKSVLGSEIWVLDLEDSSCKKVFFRNMQLFIFGVQIAWSDDSKYIYTTSAVFPSILNRNIQMKVVKFGL
jgi:hypothetical protein